MMSELGNDNGPQLPKPTDAMISVLIASYNHATTHIADFAKLQYQLVAIIFGLTGAALVFLANQLTQQQSAQGVFLLFFPWIAYATVLVETYLHAQIKKYGAYVEIMLRPKIEAIIEVELGVGESNSEAPTNQVQPNDKSVKDPLMGLHAGEFLSFFDWEQVHHHAVNPGILTGLFNTTTTVLSLFILVLPLIPAFLAIVLYYILAERRAVGDIEKAIFALDIILMFVVVLVIGLIGLVSRSLFTGSVVEVAEFEPNKLRAQKRYDKQAKIYGESYRWRLKQRYKEILESKTSKEAKRDDAAQK
ncbi:MAG: hypothetical protein U0452_05560 [Anaerolineae bacterium]